MGRTIVLATALLAWSGVAQAANCEAEGIRYQCQVPRDNSSQLYTDDAAVALYLSRPVLVAASVPKQAPGYRSRQ